jgi:hypothetical protein
MKPAPAKVARGPPWQIHGQECISFSRTKIVVLEIGVRNMNFLLGKFSDSSLSGKDF